MPLSIHRCAAALCAVACLLSPAPARAQAPPDPSRTAPVHLGPVGLGPVLSLTTGTDTNVFAQPDDPKQDFVTTLSAKSDGWLRLGAARLSGNGSLDYLHFQQYTDQGGLNGTGTLRLEVPRNRISPYVTGGYSSVKQRNLDINLRFRTVQVSASAGARLRLGGRTSMDVSAQITDVDYGEDTFGDVVLNQVLARRSNKFLVTARRRATPMTSLVLSGDATRDRFRDDPLRDTDTQSVQVGFESEARIDGRATVGYRWFRPLHSVVPAFEGVVGSAELRYAFLRASQLTLTARREVEYSFQALQPYFVANSAQVELAQAITRTVALAARVGQQRNDYRAVAGLDELSRYDTGLTYGGGVTWRVGSALRLLGYADYYDRTSNTFNDFSGSRWGGSLSYTF